MNIIDEIVKKRSTLPIKRLLNIWPFAQVDKSAQLRYFRPEFSLERVYFFEQCDNILTFLSQKSDQLWIHMCPHLKVFERVQEIQQQHRIARIGVCCVISYTMTDGVYEP